MGVKNNGLEELALSNPSTISDLIVSITHGSIYETLRILDESLCQIDIHINQLSQFVLKSSDKLGAFD
jgi:hypothetical protein